MGLGTLELSCLIAASPERTTDFAPSDLDSIVELALLRTRGGTLKKLTHREIPGGQGDRYTKVWQGFYFEPLARHFATGAEKTATRPSRAR